MPQKPKEKSRKASEPDPNSVIKVLISTDNHLGYLERDPIRGDDSFRAFEEVLEIANANCVDMVLLGGDLFHDNKPSRSTIVKTMRILRKACLSPEGAIRLAVRTNPAHVNYMNPSIAISLPIFVIHGNHDDPTGGTGLEALSSIDILAEAGLVTYFGKMTNSRKIDIHPILLQKQETRLALYGLGNIRDEVLYNTWAKERELRWLSPAQHSNHSHNTQKVDSSSETSSLWFNLFVLHQNRVTRGAARGISETLLPPWLDYVVWGHEHDSIPDLTLSEPPVVQPGSTVATSLIRGESKQKHCILLEVHKGKLKHRPVPLYTVRSFEFEDVALSDQDDLSEPGTEAVKIFLKKKIRDMIEKQNASFDIKLSGFHSGACLETVNNVKYPPVEWYIKKLTDDVRRPLIRLRVEISGNWDLPNPQRFGHDFTGEVASASTILLFYRRKLRPRLSKTFLQGRQTNSNSIEEGERMINGQKVNFAENGDSAENLIEIPKLVQFYLCHPEVEAGGLKFLELDQLSIAVDEFVSKHENKAILDYVSGYLKVQQDKTLEEAMKKEVCLGDEEMLRKFSAAAKAATSRAIVKSIERPNMAEELLREKSKAIKTGKRSRKQEKLEGNIGDTVMRNVVEEDEEKIEAVKNVCDSIGENDSSLVERLEIERVHQLVMENPKLARIIKVGNKKIEVEEGSDDEEIGTASRAKQGASGSRGRKRKVGRSIEISKARKPPLRTGGSSSTRPRRSSTKKEIVLIESDEGEKAEIERAGSKSYENVEQEEEEEEEEEEEKEYIPVKNSRKRRATSSGASRTGRSRAVKASGDDESIARPRGRGFSSRAKVRRSSRSIDIDEGSGDDAM